MKSATRLGCITVVAVLMVSLPAIAQSRYIGNDGQSVNGDPVPVKSNGDLHNNGLATGSSSSDDTASHTTVITSDSMNGNATKSSHHNMNNAGSSSSSSSSSENNRQ